MTLRSELGKPF